MVIGNKIRSALVGALVIGALVIGAPVGAAADELDARLAKVAVGETREGAVAIMGRRPDVELNATTLGIGHAQLRWNAGDHLLVIVLVFDRVVATRACSDSTNC